MASLVADRDELGRRDAHERRGRVGGRFLVQYDLQALLGCPAVARRNTARRAPFGPRAGGPPDAGLRRTWVGLPRRCTS